MSYLVEGDGEHGTLRPLTLQPLAGQRPPQRRRPAVALRQPGAACPRLAKRLTALTIDDEAARAVLLADIYNAKASDRSGEPGAARQLPAAAAPRAVVGGAAALGSGHGAPDSSQAA